MITLLGLPTRKTIQRPTSAACISNSVGGVHATVIVREMLARALQANFIAREEGLAVMRWLDHIDEPNGVRDRPRPTRCCDSDL